MMDELNRAPVPEELLNQQQRKALQEEKERALADLEKAEDRMLDRLEAAVSARLSSQQASQQSKIRTRPLMTPKLKPVGRGRGRR